VNWAAFLWQEAVDGVTGRALEARPVPFDRLTAPQIGGLERKASGLRVKDGGLSGDQAQTKRGINAKFACRRVGDVEVRVSSFKVGMGDVEVRVGGFKVGVGCFKVDVGGVKA
jgi:hypothetical protein